MQSLANCNSYLKIMKCKYVGYRTVTHTAGWASSLRGGKVAETNHLCWSHQILLLQAALQPSLGFGLLNYHSAFSAGRFYGVLLPVARPSPNLEENQWFRAFQLSPQGAASVWNDASGPVAEGGTMGEKWPNEFCRKVTTSTPLFGFFYMP